MPNVNDIFRTMDWSMAVEKMPNKLSYFLPSGDPYSIHDDIKKELRRMKAFGPLGRFAIEMYENDELTESEFEAVLDDIMNNLNYDHYIIHKEALDVIERESDCSRVNDMIPYFFSSNILSEDMIESIEILQKLYEKDDFNMLRENNNTIQKEPVQENKKAVSKEKQLKITEFS